ncbi:complement C1q-like protein 3 [Ruditapes philippinarum]|uniref:complement C1q-like protein 3 n=1 Tax=Ruditapes philippinarum TaxID=129788 RepID=UPI00295B3D2A|nr:complement C1q-like protein 3 [Ruditapes philippinarum]
MHFLKYLSAYVVLFCHQHVTAAGNEPACSKFDYEEKLLGKMIRMEVKMEQMVNEIKKTKDDVLAITNDVTQTVQNAEHNIHEFHRNINETINKFAEKFEQEKAKITALSDKSFIPKIAFNARLSSEVNLGANVKVVFDTVLMNEGEGYDKTSGIFSVSQDGVYFFSAHLCNQGDKVVHYKIVKDDEAIAVSTLHDLDNVYTCNSVSTVAMLKTGEQVWVQTTDVSYIFASSYRWDTFLGILLNR